LFLTPHQCWIKNEKNTMAKMTKSQLVTVLSEKTGLAKKEVTGFFDELVAIAYKEVKKTGEFVLPGFGKMVKAKRKARMGVNPATGEKIKIAAKTVVKFRLAKAAKEAVL
jgi:DNA-binding protein HU-beta